MRYILALVALVIAAPAGAQVQSRPTDPPLVTAVNESWYRLREPLQFAGELYFPAGATIFFNGNTMVRAGHYNGVPLYVDATVEPYSIVLVPGSRGVMQPYERLREGALAGTTGSRAPSFPVRLVPMASTLAAAAVAPTATAFAPGAITAFTPAGSVPVDPLTAVIPAAVASPAAAAPPGPTSVNTLRQPENNDGIWIGYDQRRWVSAGPAALHSDRWFTRVGEYAGFPVYKRTGVTEDVIWVPTREGFVAPYRLRS
jgi:hypothetical protein